MHAGEYARRLLMLTVEAKGAGGEVVEETEGTSGTEREAEQPEDRRPGFPQRKLLNTHIGTYYIAHICIVIITW